MIKECVGEKTVTVYEKRDEMGFSISCSPGIDRLDDRVTKLTDYMLAEGLIALPHCHLPIAKCRLTNCRPDSSVLTAPFLPVFIISGTLHCTQLILQLPFVVVVVLRARHTRRGTRREEPQGRAPTKLSKALRWSRVLSRVQSCQLQSLYRFSRGHITDTEKKENKAHLYAWHDTLTTTCRKQDYD